MVAQKPSSPARLAPLVRFSTPFLSLSLAVTLYTTGLLAWRIIRVQNYSQKQGLSKDNGKFSPALELVIESSALYAASLLVFVVLLAMKSPNQAYPQDIHPQIAVCPKVSQHSCAHETHSQGIAPTLLIFRITAGHARREEEWTSPAKLEIQFTHTTESSHAGFSSAGEVVRGLPISELTVELGEQASENWDNR